LAEQKQLEEQQAKAGLRERAKTMKLNGEIRALLLRNELEGNQAQVCERNKLTKQVLLSLTSKDEKKSRPKENASGSWQGAATPGSK
jgi:hypothetical protein